MKVCIFCGCRVNNNASSCTGCGANQFVNLCPNCSSTFVGQFCSRCGTKFDAVPKSCPDCGTTYFSNACPACGYTPIRNAQQAQKTQTTYIVQQQPQQVRPANASRYNKTTALVVCLFFGMFGGHYFYVGRAGMGLLYLFTGGVFGLGWMIDIFVILGNSFKDSSGKYLM